ncbi:concanavalin A-like lectin protein kinase family protein [Actinidia rufa]|uniref:Concanavalin A-like lectin protein kinase family protein n=1 Tax=Actinidia rufa TaxID=165716 RepID=A0A7J0DP98_9ERIC|nr:concanavalin A-like lectin protein kinase family protein [Actinidia rufa]
MAGDILPGKGTRVSSKSPKIKGTIPSLEALGGPVTKSTDEKKRRLIAGLAVGIGTLSCGLGLFWFIKWRTRALGRKKDTVVDAVISNDFEVGTGSRRFTFRELIWATNNFSEGKLGEGGFRGVYKGLLRDTKVEMPVKRVSRGSKQGKRREFLLVYEFMPNGSLDSHLFGGKSKLTLAVRYKIVLGLALALLYLHEECEQCVVHRVMKSSNVMLDSNYNAKLGNFGLARLLDHELGAQTIVLAGTTGYLTPECVTTGKANKEFDTYSFGFVALEIACGRRPVELKWEPSRVRLIDWVWDLYGGGSLAKATIKATSFPTHRVVGSQARITIGLGVPIAVAIQQFQQVFLLHLPFV